jgi:hypothetical protein
MRFCVECGSTLPDAPIVINFGGGSSNPGGPPTNPFGGQTQQQQGGQGSFGNNFPNQFSNVPPPPRKSNKKTFLIIGGILFLFLLVFIAGAAVVGYNMMKKDVVLTPTPAPSVSPSPTASTKPSSTKSPSPTKSTTPQETPGNTSGATAELDRVWVDYNVTEDGRKGMRIHTKFTVHKMKDVDSYLAIYFEKKNGDKLYSTNKQYRSKDGQVALFKSLKPSYDDTAYEDTELFVPYDEFNLDSGTYQLKMDIDVIYENGDLVQHMKYHEFEYTEP